MLSCFFEPHLMHLGNYPGDMNKFQVVIESDIVGWGRRGRPS